MSVGERQRVEIVRCLLQSPRLLIMDEPTSVLTPQAVATLFETLRRLAAEQVSILYISHKLDEVRALCDSATVLRGGRVSGSAMPREETQRKPGAHDGRCRARGMPADAARSRARRDLSCKGLTLASTDPFGTQLAGRRSRRARGRDRRHRRRVRQRPARTAGRDFRRDVVRSAPVRFDLCGRDCGIAESGAASRLGLELRARRAARARRGARDESGRQRAADGARRRARAATASCDHGAARHSHATRSRSSTCKCGSELSLASSLSGGNLQKFIVGREIRLAPKVMVVAQPTWGVDIGASQLIRQALIDLRDRGVAVLVISEELDELYAICDRLAVLRRRTLVARLPDRGAAGGNARCVDDGRFRYADSGSHAVSA